MTARFTLALWLFVLCGSAQAQVTSNEPNWVNGTPLTIVQAEPETWAYQADANTLRSVLTGLTCPASVATASLVGARSQFGGECLYRANDDGVVWATGMAATPADAMAHLAPVYQSLEEDADIQLEPVEITHIGACALEIRRMRNINAAFWMSVSDLYAPDALHQFRTAAGDEPSRNAVDAVTRELLRISISEKCGVGPAS